jgi:hypothetical protein
MPLVPHPKRCANVVTPPSSIRALTQNDVWLKPLLTYTWAEDSSVARAVPHVLPQSSSRAVARTTSGAPRRPSSQVPRQTSS